MTGAAGAEAAAAADLAALHVVPPVQRVLARTAGTSSGSEGGGTTMAVADGPASALQLLRSFLATQEERSQLYSRLHAGFRAYLARRDEPAYRVLMGSVTHGFAECSRKVVAVERTLQAPPVERPDLAMLLRRVQEGEREKLQVTVSLHALRTAMALHSDRQRNQQQQDSLAAAAAASSAAGPHASPGTDLGTAGHAPDPVHLHQHHPGGCGCCHHRKEEDEVEEASEEECDAAVREIMRRLDGVVAAINDTLEEVAQERLELEGLGS